MTNKPMQLDNFKTDRGEEDHEHGEERTRFTIKINGKHCLEGYMMMHLHLCESLRASGREVTAEQIVRFCDPTLISEMYHISPEDLGITKKSDRIESLETRVGNLEMVFTEICSNIIRNVPNTESQLSDTQEMLLHAASENEPLTGEELASKAGIMANSNVRTSLSTLVKLQLLKKSTKGYLRAPSKPLSGQISGLPVTRKP